MFRNYGGDFMKELKVLVSFLILIFSYSKANDDPVFKSEIDVHEKDVFSSEGQYPLGDSNINIQDIINDDRNIFSPSNVKFPQLDSMYVPPSNVYDEIAKQLAGLYISDNQLNNPIYIDYARFVDAEWKKLSDISLSKIEDWSSKNIMPHIKDSETLFYPFGGPDIAYALKFFPRMQNYILVGLEPIGNFEDIKQSIKHESAILALKQAISQYLRKGYFITSQMMTQLSDRRLKGALCLILIELVKIGYTIDLIEDISISPEGHEVLRQKGMVDCVKVVFKSTQEGTSQNVYYMRTNLCNYNQKLSHVINFVKRFSFVTLIKSASYVLHDKVASQIKDFILQNTKAVLQDDTGIPFHNFDAKWEKNIFGIYTQPTLPIFKAYRQQNLSNYYATRETTNIGFKIGYGFDQGRPNLLLAVPTYREIIQQMQNLKSEDTSQECPCKRKESVPEKKDSNVETIVSEQNEATDGYKKSLTKLLSF
ncbi:MAG: hypothetical protein LBF44_01680 [Holosporaceae bacterium]|jgi:hypothetical protein|nr:hypothetical protein [Holosporaceae bacterium]